MAKDDVPSAPELPGARKVTLKKDEEPEFAPKPTKEEKDLQSASEQMQEEAPELHNESPSHPPLGQKPKRSFKKVGILLLVLLILAAIGYGGWYVALRKKPVDSSSKNGSGITNQEQTQPQTYVPESVVYAFRATDSDNYTVYYRTAEGGDRKEAVKLDKDEVVVDGDVVGKSVAFATTKALFTSTNGGTSFTKVLTLSTDQQITSVKVSQTGKHVAYGFLANAGEKNVVVSVDISGKDSKDLFTADTAGVFISDWSEDKNLMAYALGCYNCDGGRSDFLLRDLKANTTKKLIDAVPAGNTVQYEVVVDSSFTHVLYVLAGPDTESEGLSAGGPPYKVISNPIGETGKSTTVATIGAAGEKNPNGTLKYREIQVGFLAGSDTGFYSDETNVYKIVANKASLLYQADKQVLRTYFATDKHILVGTGDELSDFLLSNHNLTDKKSAQIFNGDYNTTIIGIVTK